MGLLEFMLLKGYADSGVTEVVFMGDYGCDGDVINVSHEVLMCVIKQWFTLLFM